MFLNSFNMLIFFLKKIMAFNYIFMLEGIERIYDGENDVDSYLIHAYNYLFKHFLDLR